MKLHLKNLFFASFLPAVSAGTGTALRRADEVLVTNEEGCTIHNLDFIMLEDNANLRSVEDNIREHLAAVGFDVTAKYLTKEEFNAAETSGDFHLSFSETWGAPYDPHAYANGWIAGDEGHNQALSNLDSPLTREILYGHIKDVMVETSHELREEKWEEILGKVHEQAVMLPLWGKRIPTVLNNRLTGYVMGAQQFDYPIHKLTVLSGPKTVTIAPGAQTGLFQTVSRLDPHSYRPNEFFANNWVYEGLVGYGTQGQIIPALAKNWTITENSNGSGETYTFNLRPGVTFHDGSPWNCEAAKINFDHILQDPLLEANYHGWYGLVLAISEWSCNSETEFVVKTNSKYYPFLQELSYIRPLRMLSPASFLGSPITGNSCPTRWGNITKDDLTVTCAGIDGLYGTGPFKYESRTTGVLDGETIDKEVLFLRNDGYWGGEADIEELKIVHYETEEHVKDDLLDEKLDIVWGGGVLQAATIKLLEDDSPPYDQFSVFHSGIVQHSILLLNTGKAPLDDIQVRKALIHAIDKKNIVKLELGEDTRTVENIFPIDAPYCDVDFTPVWDFDLEKATLLNCMPDEEPGNNGLAIGLGVGLGILVPVLAVATVYFFRRSKKFEVELDSMRLNEKAIES